MTYLPPEAPLAESQRSDAPTRFEMALVTLVFAVAGLPLIALVADVVQHHDIAVGAILAWTTVPLIGIAIGTTTLFRPELGIWTGGAFYALKSLHLADGAGLAGLQVPFWQFHYYRASGGVVVVNWIFALLALMFAVAAVARWKRGGSRSR